MNEGREVGRETSEGGPDVPPSSEPAGYGTYGGAGQSAPQTSPVRDPDGAAPTASGQTAPGGISYGHTVPGQAAPGQAAPGHTAPSQGHGGGTDPGPGVAGRGMFAVARAVVVKPHLWAVALTQGFRLAGPDWWRKWPPVPLPSDGLWHLRMLTAYGGDGSALPDPDDVTSYLDWCRTARQWRNR
jgi:hypothetical protein